MPYLAAYGALNAYLWPRTGKDRVPVLVYSSALLAMSLVALDSGAPRTATGGVLFLVSDTLLALQRFGGIHLPAHEGLVMGTYTAAQALLAERSPPHPAGAADRARGPGAADRARGRGAERPAQ